MAQLYADVRQTAATNPARAHALWSETRERLFRTHPQSPLPPDERADFRAMVWPYDPSLRFEVTLESDESADTTPQALPHSGPDAMNFEKVGKLVIPFPQGTRPLALYWMTGYTGGLFLAFRDATNGTHTYHAGRYLLDAAKSADLGGDPQRGTLVVDFNFAYQPSCAFDAHWGCPLAPPENRLDVPICAGERVA
jgi:hypothetical protein